MPDTSPLIPEITDEDIEWVRALMDLHALDEPRRAFLKCRSTLDVSACPGSGKTTLVVAKLAILARKWPHRAKGVCVLSHTNVAREEIQRRLGSTVVGQRLLGYPHFIDTIHAFVNRFLALPWLNSNGYPSTTIDNDLTTAYRRGALGRKDYMAVETFLAKKHSGFDRLRICGRDLSFDLVGKPFPAGPAAKSFNSASQAVKAAAAAGYFCYDEMFVWARALLEDCPDIASWLRRRFPLLILDEMQDTFELQGAMLHAVFPRVSPDIVVQRVGDPNQAIFDDAEAEHATSDPFPDADPALNLSIPNSYRFGPEIAALASPFADRPVGPAGLHGAGPKPIVGARATCRHAVFVFPDANAAGVLDAYGKYVLANFDDAALTEGAVTAVGAVHQDASDIAPGHPHFPKSIPHYWPGYTAEISRKEPHPDSLIQYVRAAHVAVHSGSNLAPAVERIAAGLVRLANYVGDAAILKRRPRTHRAIVDVLATNIEALTKYRRLLRMLVIDRAPLTKGSWASIQSEMLAIGRALCIGDVVESNSDRFLAWSVDELGSGTDPADKVVDAGPNIYRVKDGDRHVDIRLGSIHSVKGQTHLATLVLSTHWHNHSSQCMLPWLIGAKVNGTGAGTRDRKRLLQTYVATTRPSHLICFAVPRFVFGDQRAIQNKAALADRGLQVVEIASGMSISENHEAAAAVRT